MLVINMDDNSETVLREASGRNGSSAREIREYAKTVDTVMSFEDWKKRFRDFNDNKKGDTWEILEVDG